MKTAAKPASEFKDILSVRIPPDLKRQMVEAVDAGPYRISITALVERGIKLALQELRETRKGK